MEQHEIAELEKQGKYRFENLPESPEITLEDVEVIPEDIPGWLVANDGDVTVALDVTVTPELRNEGMARELINRIQNLRKNSGLEITDKIDVELSELPEIREAVDAFGDYIATQVLANNLKLASELKDDDSSDLDIEGINARVRIHKSE